MIDLTNLTVKEVPELFLKKDEIFKENVFDMQNLKKIDSSGIAFLVQWAKTKENNLLKVKNMHNVARALIKTLCVQSLFIEV